MNPFGFVLRWLDRRIARVAAEQRRAIESEAARVAAARSRIDAICNQIAAR